MQRENLVRGKRSGKIRGMRAKQFNARVTYGMA